MVKSVLEAVYITCISHTVKCLIPGTNCTHYLAKEVFAFKWLYNSMQSLSRWHKSPTETLLFINVLCYFEIFPSRHGVTISVYFKTFILCNCYELFELINNQIVSHVAVCPCGFRVVSACTTLECLINVPVRVFNYRKMPPYTGLIWHYTFIKKKKFFFFFFFCTLNV